MDKVAAIDKIKDKKHILTKKSYLLASCLLSKLENFCHTKLWPKFAMSPRVPHADFAYLLESIVVYV
jgi:hypothetical protein